jgi:hypothetical protein
MKNLNKTLLAAALMVAAGSANAALTNGSATGANEAYLVAFDAGYVNTDATLGRTFNLDLGTTFAALQANAGTALSAFVGASNNLVGNTAWSTFTGLGATSSITYGVYAAGDTATQANNGVFVSGNAGITAPVATAATTPAGSTTTWGSFITQIDAQAARINTGAFTTSSVVKGTDAAGSGQANYVPTFDTVWGGGFGENPTAAYGSTNDLYYGATHLGSIVKRGTTTNNVTLLAQSDINKVGTFLLSGNTLSFVSSAPVSAVPLPAAVWMFGAGLMGVLRLNRRKSVQA